MKPTPWSASVALLEGRAGVAHRYQEQDGMGIQLNIRAPKRFDHKGPIEVMDEMVRESMAIRHGLLAPIP